MKLEKSIYFLWHFLSFRIRKSANLSNDEIYRYLEDIPSDSDVSGVSDDSVADKTFIPRGPKDLVSSDDDSDTDFEMGHEPDA